MERERGQRKERRVGKREGGQEEEAQAVTSNSFARRVASLCMTTSSLALINTNCIKKDLTLVFENISKDSVDE